MNSIKSDEFTKQSESFEKSIKKDLSKYLIKKAIKDGLLSEKTGQLIIKNIQ
jgi:hypothetical protein